MNEKIIIIDTIVNTRELHETAKKLLKKHREKVFETIEKLRQNRERYIIHKPTHLLTNVGGLTREGYIPVGLAVITPVATDKETGEEVVVSTYTSGKVEEAETEIVRKQHIYIPTEIDKPIQYAVDTEEIERKYLKTTPYILHKTAMKKNKKISIYTVGNTTVIAKEQDNKLDILGIAEVKTEAGTLLGILSYKLSLDNIVITTPEQINEILTEKKSEDTHLYL